jgi:hypothetical protein
VAECWLQMRMFNLPKWLLYRFFHYACIAREPRYSVLVYPICTPGSVVAASLIHHRTVEHCFLFPPMFWSLPAFALCQATCSGVWSLPAAGEWLCTACCMHMSWSCGVVSHMGGAHHVHAMTILSYLLTPSNAVCIVTFLKWILYYCSRRIINK